MRDLPETRRPFAPMEPGDAPRPAPAAARFLLLGGWMRLAVPALVVAAAVGGALWFLSGWWTFDRVLEEERGSWMAATPSTPWFLWHSPAEPGAEEVVALAPGGTPLGGSWHADLGSWGPDRLSGGPAPARDGSVAGGRWLGTATNRVEDAGGRHWRRFARRASAHDFAVLGCAPDLCGTWDACTWDFAGRVDLGPDGRVRDEERQEVGRWAGGEGVLLLYSPGWDRRNVRRFVFEAPEDRAPEFDGEYVLDEGCEMSWFSRVR